MDKNDIQITRLAVVQEVFNRLYDTIFSCAYWKLLVCLLLITIVQHGIWMPGSLELILKPAQHVFQNPFPDEPHREWVLYSYLAPILAYLAGMTDTPFQFVLFHALVFFTGFPLLMYRIRHVYGDFAARLGLMLFFLSALPAIVTTWFGNPDSYTILFVLSIFGFVRHPVILFPISFLMGINHFEQGVVIVVLLTLVILIAGEPWSWRIMLPAMIICLLGLVLGRQGLNWFFDYHNYNLTFDRISYFELNWPVRYLRNWASNPWLLIFSFYQFAILPLGLYVLYFWRTRPVTALVLGNGVAFLIMLFTLDLTRVFALLTFPQFLALLLSERLQALSQHALSRFQQIWVAAVVAGMVVPRLMIWDSKIISASWDVMINYLLTGR